MKNKLNTLVLVMILSLSTFAQVKSDDAKKQEKPNFSGTWILDEKKSYSKSEDRENVEDYELLINHSGDELKIFRSYILKKKQNRYSERLYTDKRGESNVDVSGTSNQAEIKSKTYWKKRSVIRKFSYDLSGYDNFTVYKLSSQKFELSDDGKVLTITTDFILSSVLDSRASATINQNGYDAPSFKLIFNKQ